MNVILDWLSQQVSWIGVICLFGAAGYSIAAIAAKRKRDSAQFTLERDIYQQRMARAGLVTVLFIALAATVFAVSRYWIPSPIEDEAAATTPASGLFTLTPNPTVLVTPAVGSIPVASAVEGATVLTDTVPTSTVPTSTVPTVIISAPDAAVEPTPLPAPTEVSPAAMQPDCPDPGAQLTYPAAGSDLSGVIEVLGTASVNAFSFYRFEVIFPGAETPNFIAQIDKSVDNGSLGFWDISDPIRYPPGGPYRFRLVVVDIYGNTTTCVIPVNIVGAPE